MWKAPGGMCEQTNLDAVDRDHRGARGGGVGPWAAGLPGLFGAAVAVGVRTLARGAAAAWDPVGQAASGVLWRLWRHARAVSVVVGAASARRGRGDRRGAAASRERRGAPPDRQRTGPAGGNGSWVAQGRQVASGEPADVRDQARSLARSRAGRGRTRRQQPGRRGRGDHARCPRVGAAVRSPRRRCVGTCRVPDWRAAARSATAPAVADVPRGRARARPHRHPAARGGCGSSAAATLHGST